MMDALNYFGGDELAAPVWEGKYAMRNEKGELMETSPEQMHRRLAIPFARINQKFKLSWWERYFGSYRLKNLSEYGKYRALNPMTEEEIFTYFDRFSHIVPQGSIMDMLGNLYKIGSLSNCFVIGQPTDSYGGIFQKDQEMVQLMKRRGGVGIDISTLRPSKAPVTNAAGTSTGAVSFMHRFSNSTEEVAQEGRRGALMLSIDIRHPDVTDFIKIKRDRTSVTGANISVMNKDEFMQAVKDNEDYILRWPCEVELDKPITILGTIMAGKGEGESCNMIFHPDWDLPEYNVTRPYDTKEYGRVYFKKVKARELNNELVESNHFSAEPGNIYVDRHRNYSPDGVYPQYRGITTNPCGEIFMGMYDACRLIAMNFMSIVDKAFEEGSNIDYEKLYQLSYDMQTLGDNLVELEMEHIQRIIKKIESDPEPREVKQIELDLWHKIYDVAKGGRRTGSGFTALGDMLAALNLKYDSDDAKFVIEEVMHQKMKGELDATIDMALLRGPFEGWDRDKEFETISYRDNKGDLYVDNGILRGRNEFFEMLIKEFPEQAERMWRYGRRNVSWSTVAPTGTVSLMTQTTGGIEPLFAYAFFRKKKINPNDRNARVDFTDAKGVQWQEFPVLHPQFKRWIENSRAFQMMNAMVGDGSHVELRNATTHESLPTLTSVANTAEELPREVIEHFFKNSPWYGSTANDIDWIKRVELQAVVQRYTTHSISSTINLPEDVSKEKIAEIYMTAWEKGLKGVTVYRDKCRDGVLTNISANKAETSFNYHEAPERPKELDAKLHITQTKGKKFAVVVGFLEGKPYEMFAFADPLFQEGDEGKVIKVKKYVYKFVGIHSEIDNLQLTTEHSDEAALMRLVSMLLRYGAKPQYVVEQIEKVDLNIQAFGQSVKRILKKYIPEGAESAETCSECGAEGSMVYEEGCKKCKSCGSSKC